MLVRLNHLESEIGGREISMLLANGAYNATQAFGRHGYLGHLIWAFHILEETVAENPGNLDIDSRLKKVRGQAEQIETAREGFELTQQAREAVAESRWKTIHKELSSSLLACKHWRPSTSKTGCCVSIWPKD